jgi:hypothetical protein
MTIVVGRVFIILSSLAMLGGLAACKNNTTLPTPEQVTETFTGTLPPCPAGVTPPCEANGKSHNFTVNYGFATTNATVTVKSLVNAATSAPLSTTIGIGFGTIGFDQSCQLAPNAKTPTASVGTPNGPVPVQAQTYCVQIYDAGTLTTLGVSANYTVEVTHY